MEIWEIITKSSVFLFLSVVFPYILTIIIGVVLIRILIKKKNYFGKIIEMKKAPLGISNLLKDSVKRRIIRTLSRQRKYVSAISREINENAPRTRYHLKQLERAGLVKSFKLAREAYFSLTKKGQWCLKAINYYYPSTNLQFLISRMREFFGTFKIRRQIFKERGQEGVSI